MKNGINARDKKWRGAVYLLLFLLLATVLCGCPYENLHPEPDYIFNFPFDVTPQRDTIYVGDTLWLTAKVPDEFLDIKSNTTVTFERAKFNIPLIPCMMGHSTNQNNTDYKWSLHSFSYWTKHGNYVLFDEITVRLSPEYKNHQYLLSLAIIPKQEGLFFLDSGYGDRYSGSVKGESKNASTIQIFNVLDIKEHLLGNNYDEFKTMEVDRYVKEYGNYLYFFYVKKKVNHK
jgi:hypothetical protein